MVGIGGEVFRSHLPVHSCPSAQRHTLHPLGVLSQCAIPRCREFLGTKEIIWNLASGLTVVYVKYVFKCFFRVIIGVQFNFIMAKEHTV